MASGSLEALSIDGLAVCVGIRLHLDAEGRGQGRADKGRTS
ncbi:hypothetical protein SEF58_12520 [Neomoorella humiferrea]